MYALIINDFAEFELLSKLVCDGAIIIVNKTLIGILVVLLIE